MKLSSHARRIQPVHTMERSKHLKGQDEEIKFPKQNTASPILVQQRDIIQTTFHDANGNHAIIILSRLELKLLRQKMSFGVFCLKEAHLF